MYWITYYCDISLGQNTIEHHRSLVWPSEHVIRFFLLQEYYLEPSDTQWNQHRLKLSRSYHNAVKALTKHERLQVASTVPTTYKGDNFGSAWMCPEEMYFIGFPNKQKTSNVHWPQLDMQKMY